MKKIILFIIIIFSNYISADEYSFDISEFEKKKYDISGNIKINSIFNKNNKISELYHLKYYGQEFNDYSDVFLLKPELFFRYDINNFKFNINGNISLSYSDNDWNNTETLYESYIQYKSGNLIFEVGKKSIKWGKGYIWNPVSYAGRQKDADDVDASLEGYYLFNSEWIKSWNSEKLKNISLNFVLLPSDKNLNYDYGQYNTVNFISKFYSLYCNSDIDLYFLINNKDNIYYGVDFSKNLRSDLEIHFEYSHSKNYEQFFTDNSGLINSRVKSNNNFLAGTRYITKNEITFIFEYLYNSAGLSKKQTDNFYSAVRNSISTNTLVSYYKQNLIYFNNQFISKEYLYLKMSKPQPYDILYFTPALFSIYNVTDKSITLTLELKYSGITNLEFISKYSVLCGSSFTQFGEKMNEQKLDLQLKYYF